MATNCSNIKAAPAFRGQSALVTLSGPESLSVIPLLELGQACLSESSQAVGHIDWIDTYGHSFSVKPFNYSSDWVGRNLYYCGIK